MASTPPAQIRAEARTPPTPLHGSAYHSKSSPSRYNTRSSARKTPDSANSSFTHSPQSPHSTALHSHPELTPRRKTRRVQALSPVSPESDAAPQAHPSHNASYLSATTVLSEGMLPTPVKTPRKKHISKSTVGARALFQDPSNAVQSPRKTQKRVRHNGFSLESFSEASSSQDAIQIHIDSRDQVPEADPTEDNPFHVPSQPVSKKRAAPSAPQRPVRSSKRQRLDKEEKKPLDPQVEDAIKKDEGMVYVFRGKKVYRRFEDAGDEEEIIDPEELGLLERAANGHDIVKPLKTLTRKSIRPRRLFQDEIQQQQQQPASHTDEEAETEIEEDHPAEADDPDSEEVASPSRPKSSRTRDIAANGGSKKRSPFDSWKRLKSGSQSAPASSVPATRGRKRTAAEALEV